MVPNARVVASTLLSALLASSCTASTGDETAMLAVHSVDEAIDSVEAVYGAPAAFYEINATEDGVNLFISTSTPDGEAAVLQARFTESNGLVVAGDPVEAEGSVFTGDAVDFDETAVLAQALEELSTSTARAFIITAAGDVDPGAVGDATRVEYRLVMESRRGGRLVVLLSGDGSILGSDISE